MSRTYRNAPTTVPDFCFTAVVLSSLDSEDICDAFGLSDAVDPSEADDGADLAALTEAISSYRDDDSSDVFASPQTATVANRRRAAFSVAS